MPDIDSTPAAPPRLSLATRRACQLALAVLASAVCWLAFNPDPPPAAEPGWDKANHVLAFVALGLTAELAFWPLPARRWRNAAGLLIFGGWIELVQTRIPGRAGEWPDLLADAVGITLGLLLAALAMAWQRRD